MWLRWIHRSGLTVYQDLTRGRAFTWYGSKYQYLIMRRYCQFIASMLGILLYSLSSKKIFSTCFFSLFRVSPNEVQLTSRNSCRPCLFRIQYYARLLLWVICLNIVASSSRRHLVMPGHLVQYWASFIPDGPWTLACACRPSRG